MAKKKFEPVSSQVNFPEKEREILNFWYESGIVDKHIHKNDNAPKTFSFFDGPITANNPMGVHHAWGRTYKDLFQRFHTMKGEAVRHQNGFDCQGLWVEVEVEKELGFKTKKDIEEFGVANFVNKCKERVLKYSAIQTEQSKRLGYFMDWANSYFTMSDENNYMIWHVLKTCWERGWIYKGNESVPWCPRCETAISQHEMLTEDYKEVTHKSVFFALPIKERESEFLLVWTTTPWTLPANVAVAVDESLEYVLVNDGSGKKYWVVEGKESLISSEPQVVKKVKGSELVGLKYSWVFDQLSKVQKVAQENPEKFHLVIATDPRIMPITTTEGTGLVHTAVSAGSEDFHLGKKLGLPMIPVIQDNADYMDDLDFLSGQNAKKHPEIILDFLQSESEKGTPWLFKVENYTHRYPACWRCKTELVWKVAEEWYISMDTPDPSDDQKRTLREQLQDNAKKITWLPQFGLDRELDWLKNMHDWLISKKNRYWGLALPIYECSKCGEFEVIGGKEELKQRAVEGWEKFEGNSPHKPWIDEVKIKCSKCGEVLSRLPDVGNVWLDAGIISFSTLHYLSDRKYWEKWYPADFITESFPGQFKNWFYSMLVMGTILDKSPSFKTVLGYGSLLAEDGRPMHKSWGNSIEFNEGADTIGADVMRWLFASANPTENVLFGYKKADEVRRRFLLILWNTYSFFVSYANLTDGWQETSPSSDNVLDRWILARLKEVVKTATQALDHFDAMTATASVEKFVEDLSTWYVRRSRERVRESSDNLEDKKAFLSTCYKVLTTISRLVAPVLPFVSEQMYKNLTGEESVHLTDWPEVEELTSDENQLIEQMELVRNIATSGHAGRKNANLKVRQPLASASVRGPISDGTLKEELLNVIMDEINVKKIVLAGKADEWSVEFDTNLTTELVAEGRARDLVREIQEARKMAGTQLSEKVEVELPDWPVEFEEYIKKETLATKLMKGEAIKIIRSV